jgi:septin family protein
MFLLSTFLLSTLVGRTVLLLGETGVGKSTFINAFVNYLKFETLQKAERGEPVVLIPASFLITTGDQFDEFIVKFGNPDPNENHEHQGQSVTQQCKSYVFDLNDRTYLRLIDTPGIGDTRGINQDVKNIDHILTYINNFTHLNAICLLLKPNASRLNIFFRSCLSQLLTYLTPIAYNNILFCFTNARATFYAPGDTGPLLRKMLHDENLNIPFEKGNTFCFDSESFRYLAARKRNINFDDYQKQECTDSWNKSVTESLRLLNSIQTRQPYYLDEWLSPRKAALDISTLARPLIETLRLIIYNWKLSEAKLIANQIVLNSNPIDIDMCTHCAQTNLTEVRPFWIIQYQRVLSKSNTSEHHLCPSDGKHFLIETIVQHELVAEPAGLKNERWQSSFNNFLFKCDRLLHFLRQQDQSVEDDPFQPILERFLEEEQQISQIRSINSHMNRKVREVLQTVKQKRQQNSQQLLEANERLSLNQVYQIINELIIIPTVQKQTDSIKKSRQLKLKIHECRIPTNVIQNRTFN